MLLRQALIIPTFNLQLILDRIWISQVQKTSLQDDSFLTFILDSIRIRLTEVQGKTGLKNEVHLSYILF